jgi:dGTPase
MRADSAELKRFLFANLYRHPQVNATTAAARQIVRDLFSGYMEQPERMAPEFASSPDRARGVADYIAGMTDRFARREHQRLTGRDLFAEFR